MNLLKKILLSTEIVYHLKNKNKIFIGLNEERSYELRDLEKLINLDNLIYKYKTEGIIWNDFLNYQKLIELFKDLRDGNTNPKEV